MIIAGVDIGSSGSKAVLLENERIMAWRIIPTTGDSEESAVSVMNLLLRDYSLGLTDINYIVGTGYGRVNIPFAQETVTELSCHAYGSHWLFPEVRTILDMGGQDCKVIRCDGSGRLINFLMNDKCAAGTGRYLERAAAALNLGLDEIGPRSLQPVKGALEVSGMCAVFAESDILRLKREGAHINDILAGAHDAIIRRLCALVERLGIERELCFTGGVAKNVGVVRRLEQRFGLRVLVPPEPLIIGALGAALFAARKAVALVT